MCQSTDDSVSWSLLFKLLDGRQYWQVIKVITDHGDDFWTVEQNYDFTWYIRVYNLNRKLYDGNVTWGDIIPINKTYSAFEIRLSYDYNMNIFLSDHFTVNLFSVNDQYHCQLLSNQLFDDRFRLFGRLAIDKEHQLLYVGDDKRIQVFKLEYGEEEN